MAVSDDQQARAQQELFTSVQTQIDRRIETVEREIDAAVKTLGERMAALDRVVATSIEALDQRMKTLFDGNTKAIEIAEREREKAAQQLRAALQTAEQEREKAAVQLRGALTTAEQEREKAAAQLRVAMENRIVEGDDNLNRHIGEQITSVKNALTAVEKLSEEKDKRFEAIREAAQLAVDKALISQKELAEKHNDLIRSGERKEATYVTKPELDGIREFIAKAVPREVMETELKAISKEIAQLDRLQQRSSGGQQANQERRAQVQPWQIWAAGTVITIVVTLIVIVANVLTTS